MKRGQGSALFILHLVGDTLKPELLDAAQVLEPGWKAEYVH